MDSKGACAKYSEKEDASQCTPSSLLNVAKYLGRDWKRLGRQLDIEEALLEDIEDKYRAYGFQEMAYQVMVIWQQTVGKEATISALEENLSLIDRTDTIASSSHVAANTLAVNISSKSPHERKLSETYANTKILKNVEDKLRRQYKDLEMKGLPWMEDLLLTLDEYYVDLTMSRMDRRGRALPSTSIVIEEILKTSDDEKNPSRVLVEGGPGLGKSTLAAKLAYDWARDETYMNVFDLVVLLPLRHVAEDFEELIRMATGMNSEETGCLFQVLNDNSKHILFIFDGYDEASPKTEKLILPVLQCDIFPRVIVVVTSRPGKFPSKQRTCKTSRVDVKTKVCKNVDIAPTFSYFIDRRICIQGFTLEQQDIFIKKHLQSYTHQERLNIRSKLGKVSDKEFLKSPLFLLMLIVVFTTNPEDNKSFETQTDLYKHVFNCVIKRYFSKSGEQFPSDVNTFCFEGCTNDPHDLITQFSNFALWAVKADSLSFSQEQILKTSACDDRILNLGFLMQGVHVKGLREKLVYEPVHKSLLEFAAAYAVWLLFKANKLDDWRKEAILLRPRMENSQSRQLCFPFLAGLMGSDVSALFSILTPFASEYSSDFSMLVLSLLETKITDEVLHYLKPLLPEMWLIPWCRNDNGLSLSYQHETMVRFGTEAGIIKLLSWEMGHPALLPTDVEMETIVCEITSITSPHNHYDEYPLRKLHCKNLWFTLCSYGLEDVNQHTFFLANEIFTFQHVSYNFIDIPKWFPVFIKRVSTQNRHINWLKTELMLDNDEFKYLLWTIMDLITRQKLQKLALFIDGNCQQKHIDNLITCASKSSNLGSFILRSSETPSNFFVDLAQLCDDGRKAWSWVHLEGIKVRCGRVMKSPGNINQLDIGKVQAHSSIQDKFQCCVNSSLSLSSSLLSKASEVWNFSCSLQELNIVIEPTFLDEDMEKLKIKLPSLKVLVLTMTTFEFTVNIKLGSYWYLTSDVVCCLQRFEIWKVETNPFLATEIIYGISTVLGCQMRNSVREQGSEIRLQYFLLNMPMSYYKPELDVTSSQTKNGRMFLPAILRLRQCLIEKVLLQLEIVRDLTLHITPQISMMNSWMGLFTSKEGFRLQYNLWGSRQDDSTYSQGMHGRSPGLLHRISITHEETAEVSRD